MARETVERWRAHRRAGVAHLVIVSGGERRPICNQAELGPTARLAPPTDRTCSRCVATIEQMKIVTDYGGRFAARAGG